MFELDNKYNPTLFERKVYDFWLKNNYFHAEINNNKPYSIVIPPPNITGYLHIGHALNNSLQDIMIRTARMKGYSACWVPGTDHAGIATQNVVERELNKQGISRFDLGREKFVEKVWEWKEKYGSKIISQLKSLGCSCDWQRLRFTLDDQYCKAVTFEFVKLYKDGLIYRGNYMINWCPRCLTAISDIEVEHKQKKGSLWDIKYPIIDKEAGLLSKEDFIVVSTTRPETMLGDTAVAVNPKDKRYKKYVGKFVLLPLMNRKIPVISDDYVDMNFGTGALKVTPAHDPNDFELAEKHNLDKINIMDDSGVLNENAGIYKGLERYEARQKILKDLKNEGLLVKESPHISSVGYCSRCDSIIEPRISNQWFVSMKKLAKPAIKAVKEGKIKFIPKKWEKIYFNWMENIKDWCISRQLWWGHRIPVWYCKTCNQMIVSETEPQKCVCGRDDLVQDTDVLDTWFSSCLWPFAVFGWPKKTAELSYFFPTSLLVTAHDIIFFWVARMIMMSLYFMKEIPFKEVFINPLVNDIYGQKMSKSQGNVIDPVTIIEKFGSDPLRFTLASLTTPGKNLLLGEEKIEGSRNFANKIWNASKFVISNIKTFGSLDFEKKEYVQLDIWDKWILSKLSKTLKLVEKYFNKYNIAFICKTLVNFFWGDFCDWYIEASKIDLYNFQNETLEKGNKEQIIYNKNVNDKNVNESLKLNKKTKSYILETIIETKLYILWYVLEKYLRLLHPFMPFLTEVIWQNLPHTGSSIMISSYPANDNKFLDKVDDNIEEKIEKIIKIISEIRRVRTEQKINPGVKINVNIKALNKENLQLIDDNKRYIMNLAKVKTLSFVEPEDKKGFIKTVVEDDQIFIDILDVYSSNTDLNANIKTDINSRKSKILSDIEKINEEIEKINRKLLNPQFLEKAPESIIKKEKLKYEEQLKKLQTLKEQLSMLNNLK